MSHQSFPPASDARVGHRQARPVVPLILAALVVITANVFAVSALRAHTAAAAERTALQSLASGVATHYAVTRAGLVAAVRQQAAALDGSVSG
ncbi:MAG: hypothetical protein AAFU65_17140, partial [Pseudomonadota bacterium]